MCISGTRTRAIQNELERRKCTTDIGIPVVAFKNLKKPNVPNGHEYKIVSTNNDLVMIEREGKQISLKREQFDDHFRYAFCDSVFRNSELIHPLVVELATFIHPDELGLPPRR
jgi:hypothetical protein